MVTTMTPATRFQGSRQESHQGGHEGQRRHGVNVGEAERMISVVGGAVLGLYGLSRGSLGGFGLAALGGALVCRGLTGQCQMYQSLGLNTAESTSAPIPGYRGFKVDESITVNRPASELYAFWRNFSNLPRIMDHLESVSVNGPRSHWVAKGPLGTSVAWDAEVYNERANEMIAWQSLPGSLVATAGSIHFTPSTGGRGTLVRVNLKYDPPGGSLGHWFAWLTGRDPQQMIQEDLRRFRDLMESGHGSHTQSFAAAHA